MRRDEALRRLAAHRDELAERFGVKSVALFGSVARDEAGQESDVDVLVEFSRPVGLFEFIDLKERLEEILGTSVDVGTPSSLRPSARARAEEEAVYVA